MTPLDRALEAFRAAPNEENRARLLRAQREHLNRTVRRMKGA